MEQHLLKEALIDKGVDEDVVGDDAGRHLEPLHVSHSGLHGAERVRIGLPLEQDVVRAHVRPHARPLHRPQQPSRLIHIAQPDAGIHPCTPTAQLIWFHCIFFRSDANNNVRMSQKNWMDETHLPPA